MFNLKQKLSLTDVKLILPSDQWIYNIQQFAARRFHSLDNFHSLKICLKSHPEPSAVNSRSDLVSKHFKQPNLGSLCH